MKRFLDNYFLPICIWKKCWRNNREISPPPLPSVSCLPRRGDPTCSLTLPTDLTDNYFLFIGGYLHASTCLFVGFFLLVCGIWVLWWCGFFKRSTHDYEILFFLHSGTLNHENYTSHIVCLIHPDHDWSAGYLCNNYRNTSQKRWQNLSTYLLNKFEMKQWRISSANNKYIAWSSNHDWSSIRTLYSRVLCFFSINMTVLILWWVDV